MQSLNQPQLAFISPTRVEALRREAILEAVSFAAEQFLQAPRWEDAIHRVLARLGQATAVSRVYLFENHVAADGTLLTSQRYEWVAPGITSQLDNPILQNYPYVEGGFERWVKVLGAGQVLYGQVREFPPAEQEILAAQCILSLAVVPIFIQNEWWGFIGFDDCLEEREWHPAELQALCTAANTLGAAIWRQRMEETLRRRADEWAALHETTRDLATQHDLPTLLQTIVRRAMALLGAPAGGIYLYDPVRGELEMVIAEGAPVPRGTRLKLGEGMAGRVALTRQPLIVADYQTWEHRAAQYEGIPFAAVVEAPMLFGGELIGVLVVHELGASTRRFSEDDAQLLSLFAAQAAAAVRNARLLDEMTQRATQFALLYDAGLTLNRTLEPRTLLEYLLQIAMRVTNADHASFFRYDAVREEMRFALATGTGADIESLPDLAFRVGEERGLVGWVAVTRQPLNIPDTLAEPRWIVIDPEIRSALMIPILYDNQLYGVLNVKSKRTHAFTSQDERLLTLLANQIATVLNNARLLAETRRGLQQQRAIYRLTHILARAESLAEIYDAALVMLRDTLAADRAAILLWHREGVLRFEAWQGLSDGYRQAVTGHSPWPPDAVNPQPIVIADVARAPELGDLRDIILQEGIRALSFIPLVYQGRLLGKFMLYYDVPHAFTQEELGLAQIIADELSIGIARQRDAAELRLALAREQRLNEISHLLSSTLELPILLQKVVRLTAELIGAEAGAVALVTPDGETMIYPYLYNLPQELDQTVNPKGRGLAWQIVESGEAITLADYGAHPQALAQWVEAGVHAFIGVPLVAGTARLGALGLFHLDPAKRFGERELRLAEAVGRQAGIAIQNARLFTAEREQRELAEALRDSAVALNATLDLHEVLDRILDSVGRVLPHDTANIMIVENGIVRVLRARGYAERGLDEWLMQLRFPLHSQLVMIRAAREGVVIIPDTHAEPDWVTFPETAWIRSFASVALRALGEMIGFLNLDSATPHFFIPAHTERLQAFAAQAAVAITNARLFQETRQRAAELETLSHVSSALRQAVRVEEMLPVLAAQAAAIVGGIAATVFLVEPETGDLVGPTWYRKDNGASPGPNGARQVIVPGLRLRKGEGVAGHVVASGEIYITQDLARDPLFKFLPGEEVYLRDVRCLITLPLQTRERIIGVLQIGLPEPHTFTPTELRLLTAIAEMGSTAIQRARLFEQTERQAKELARAYEATLEGWARALDLRDKETEGHTRRVTEMTLRLARAMGVSEADLMHIRRGAILHDIGKIGVPDRILNKAAPLDEAEWEIMRRHPQYAYEMLAPIDYLRPALDIPYCHHEKWDGTGYPRGLKGEEIPLAARIFAVVDVWDALLSERAYRAGWTEEQARQYLYEQRGKHFDPQVVDAFLKLLEEQ